jgi:hypothetical protein
MITPRSGRIAVAALLLPFAAAFCAAARRAPRGGLDAVVSVDAKDMPVPQFLDLLSSQAGRDFVLTKDAGRGVFSASFKRATVREVLDALSKKKGLVFRRVGRSRVYFVRRRDDPADDRERISGRGLPSARVDVDVKDAPLSLFFGQLSAQSRARFELAGGVGARRLTVALGGVTLREALELVLAVKDLTCRRRADGVWVVAPAAS